MSKNYYPLVSIIIPVYNGENYLEEAINSALAQTYKNIEVIVVNDGSSDSTEKIIKKYIDRVKYYKKNNGGVASALNLGIKHMKGKYFSWLSHDDLYYNNKIEMQIGIIKELKEKNAILYSDYDIINENSNIIGTAMKDTDMLKTKPEYSLLRGSINGITLLIPKEAFDNCGNFNEELRCTQDYDLWLNFQKDYKFIHISEVLSQTRIHSQQDTQLNPKAIEEGNELWIKMIKSVPKDRKIILEKSEYNFYVEMSSFLKSTPYKEARLYCEEQCFLLETNIKNNINNKLVSVIIPFFNREDITIRAINSVLNQSFKNLEIILIDDCSTESVSKLKEYINKKTNITYHRNSDNLGPSFSRNEGIKLSKGDYISFLDSDDEFMLNKIEIQLTEMILKNSKASYTNYLKVQDEKDRGIEVITYTELSSLNNEFIHNSKLATPTIMVKKELLIENDILYNSNFKVCEDACFYLDILKYTDFLYIDKFLSRVYVNENSTINDTQKRLDGIKNLIIYILNDPFYNNKSNKELEYLFMGYLSISKTHVVFKDNESQTDENSLYKNKKINLIRSMYRKFVPLNIRKKINNLIL